MIWLASALASPLVLPDNTTYQLADADGDGHIDLVFAGGEAVFFGDGTGSLGSLTPLEPGMEAEDVVYTDLDGDGLPEACRVWWDHVDCHQGIGRGIGPVLATIDGRNYGLAAIDADSDGDPDLLTSGPDGITVHENDGAGGFSAWPPTPGPYPDRLFEADVDGDGDLDVATAKTYNDDTWWMERDASGLLGPAELLREHSAPRVAFADTNGDGLPDLITQSNAFPVYVALRDEVVTTHDSGMPPVPEGPYGQSVPLGSHKGYFVLAALEPGNPAGLVVCDDIAQSIRWDAGIDGGFVQLWDAPEAWDRLCEVHVADLDEDGRPDVLSGARDLTLTLDPLRGGTPTVVQRLLPRDGPVTTGDVDGDGLTDVVYGGNTDEVLWVRGTGYGDFAPTERLIELGATPTDLLLIDLNRDGWVDLVSANRAGSLWFAAGTGPGTFAAAVVAASGVQERALALDIDSDGALELLVPTATGLAVYDDDGAGSVAPQPVVGTDRFFDLAVGDTDGDGIVELVGLTGDELVVYRTGTGLVEALRGPAPGAAYAVELADRDNDGADSIVVMGPCETELVYGRYPVCVGDERIYEVAEIGGALVDQGQLGEGHGPMAVVDWGQDGSDDLFASSSIWLGTFDLSFAFEAVSERDPSLDLLPADLDNDGDLDLVSVMDGGLWAVWNRGIGDGLPPRPQGTVGDTGTTADTGTVPDTDTVPGTTTDTGTPLGTNDTDDALAIGEGEEKAEDAAACGCQSTAWPSLGTWARRR